jgi:hypothetical protein
MLDASLPSAGEFMAHPREPRSPVVEVTPEARFVFTGVVEQRGASSLFFVPPGGATAVVRVERIHYAAPSLRNQEGQQVTVVFAEGDPAEGKRVFFTNPILYGETIAVKEVKGSEPARSLDEQHERFIQMINDAETEKLRKHIASADAVVQGRVVSTKRASEPNPAKMSEHDPDWHVAIIRIEQSLKGKHKDEIAVRFPKSRDIKWYRVPKLKEGQEGVFILHRDGLELGSALLALIHPEDLLPGGADTIRRIAELV